MHLRMKVVFLVVIFFILAIHTAEPAKRDKRKVTYHKLGHQKDKIEKQIPQESKLEAKSRGEKKNWKASQADEKKYSGDVKDMKWKERMGSDTKGRHLQGKSKPEYTSSLSMDSRKINAKSKKLESIKSTSMEEFKEEKVAIKDELKQNKSPPQQLDESLIMEEDYIEETENIMDSVNECEDNKSAVKMSQNRAVKNKESILIQEDLDGKCYYEL